MVSAPLAVAITPQDKRHVEYLAIFKLYTDYKDLKITRLLNDKFKSELPRGHYFKVEKVKQKWIRMEERNDDIRLDVMSWGEDSWRVKRVLRWAEADNEKHPLGRDTE